MTWATRSAFSFARPGLLLRISAREAASVGKELGRKVVGAGQEQAVGLQEGLTHEHLPELAARHVVFLVEQQGLDGQVREGEAGGDPVGDALGGQVAQPVVGQVGRLDVGAQEIAVAHGGGQEDEGDADPPAPGDGREGAGLVEQAGAVGLQGFEGLQLADPRRERARAAPAQADPDVARSVARHEGAGVVGRRVGRGEKQLGVIGPRGGRCSRPANSLRGVTHAPSSVVHTCQPCCALLF